MPQNRLRLILKLLLIPIFIFLVVFSYTSYYILQNATFDNKKPSDVIIVLGSRTRANNSYNPCLYDRVSHAVNLYKKGFAKKIIVSGGFNPDDHYFEAEDMRKIALSLGAKNEDVIMEKKSHSTFENLTYSQKIMTDQNLKDSIVVTEAYHSPRANLVAQKLKMNHSVSPVTNTPCWNAGVFHINFYLFRDSAALIQYFLLRQI